MHEWPDDAAERYRAQYHGLPLPTFTLRIVDDEFFIIDCNAAAVELTSGGALDALGKPASAFLSNDRPTLELLRTVAARRGAVSVERHFQQFIGAGPMWARIRVTYIAPDLLLVYVVDITEQKQAEDELRRREQTFSALTEHAPDVIARYDRELRHIYINPAIERFTGLPRESFLGSSNIEAGISETASALLDERLKRVLETGRGESFHFEYESPAGLLLFHTRLEPEFNADGSVESILEISRDVTEIRTSERERTRAEQRERAAEGRIARVLASMSDAFYLLDPDGRFAAVNAQAEALLRMPADELIGRNIWDVFTEDVDEFKRMYERVVRDRAAVRFETYFRPLGGWYDVRAYPSDDGTAVFFSDVTDRHETAELLQQNVARLRALADAAVSIQAPMPLPQLLDLVTERARVIIGAHCAVAEVAGTNGTPETVRSQSCSDAYRRRFGHCSFDTPVPATGAREEGRELHAEFVNAHGEAIGVIRIRNKVAGHFSEMDESLLVHIAQLASIAIENVRLVAGLERAEHDLREILETSPLATIVVDRDLTVRMWNPAAEKLFGYPAREVVGRRYPLRDEHGEVPTHVFAQGFSGEPMRGVPLRRTRRDGSLVEFTFWNAPLRAEDGTVRGLVGVFLDVSEQRRLEDQLRQSQKMEAVGRLAGGIAHDFNNLLTAIRGHARLVLDELDEADPIFADLQEIDRSSERATALTRQLLAFSRRQVLNPDMIDLNAVVHEMQRMLRRIIGEDIQLELELAPELGTVRADVGQVEQVILNLVVNARDAMPGGGRVRIVTRPIHIAPGEAARFPYSVRPGEYVELCVRDTGTGIDEAHVPYIFDPFFTTKEMGKGTGLGLSTVYGIVKQSQGYVWVENNTDGGATFRIALPRQDGPATVSTGRHTRTRTQASNAPATILLVEDEAAVRSLARRVLQRAGYSVLEAPTGSAALEIAAQHAGAIDLLLTDVIMPETSGIELAARLRVQVPGLRVLFMSGYSEDAIGGRGEIQPGSLIEKPFTPAGLAERVARALGEA